MATISLSFDPAIAAAKLAAAEKVLRNDLGPVLEVAVMKAVQDHLDANYVGKPNKLGGPSTDYWRTVRNSAEGHYITGGDTHSVTVKLTGVGLRMKLLGGVIRPTGRISSVTGKPIKFLTIPVSPLAHGKTASDFGKDALYATPAGLMDRAGGHAPGHRLFIFAKQATIKADPNIWPSAETIRTAAGEAVLLLFNSATGPN